MAGEEGGTSTEIKESLTFPQASEIDLVLSGEGRAILYYKLALAFSKIEKNTRALPIVLQMVVGIVTQIQSGSKKAEYLERLTRLKKGNEVEVKYIEINNGGFYNITTGDFVGEGTTKVWRVDKDNLKVGIEEAREAVAGDRMVDALVLLADCANTLKQEDPDALPYYFKGPKIQFENREKDKEADNGQ